jgi:hypothetical protein
MASHKQGTISAVTTTRALGAAGSITLQQTFPASPIHEKSDQFASIEDLKEEFEKLVLDGEVNDEGHTFGTFVRDYADAPNIDDVETGAGGLPASPWVPNPTSPGPGSMNPTDQPAPPDGFGETPNDQYGVGVGSQLNPKNSSEIISSQKPGDQPLGKSSNE